MKNKNKVLLHYFVYYWSRVGDVTHEKAARNDLKVPFQGIRGSQEVISVPVASKSDNHGAVDFVNKKASAIALTTFP